MLWMIAKLEVSNTNAGRAAGNIQNELILLY